MMEQVMHEEEEGEEEEEEEEEGYVELRAPVDMVLDWVRDQLTDDVVQLWDDMAAATGEAGSPAAAPHRKAEEEGGATQKERGKGGKGLRGSPRLQAQQRSRAEAAKAAGGAIRNGSVAPPTHRLLQTVLPPPLKAKTTATKTTTGGKGRAGKRLTAAPVADQRDDSDSSASDKHAEEQKLAHAVKRAPVHSNGGRSKPSAKRWSQHAKMRDRPFAPVNGDHGGDESATSSGSSVQIVEGSDNETEVETTSAAKVRRIQSQGASMGQRKSSIGRKERAASGTSPSSSGATASAVAAAAAAATATGTGKGSTTGGRGRIVRKTSQTPVQAMPKKKKGARPVSANAGGLELARLPKGVSQMVDSSPLIERGRFRELFSRFMKDGYIYMRGALDADDSHAVRDLVLEHVSREYRTDEVRRDGSMPAKISGKRRKNSEYPDRKGGWTVNAAKGDEIRGTEKFAKTANEVEDPEEREKLKRRCREWTQLLSGSAVDRLLRGDRMRAMFDALAQGFVRRTIEQRRARQRNSYPLCPMDGPVRAMASLAFPNLSWLRLKTRGESTDPHTDFFYMNNYTSLFSSTPALQQGEATDDSDTQQPAYNSSSSSSSSRSNSSAAAASRSSSGEAQLDTYVTREAVDAVVCQDCEKGLDESNLLVCDECGHAYHTYCLRPPLPAVPDGPWTCPECDPPLVIGSIWIPLGDVPYRHGGFVALEGSHIAVPDSRTSQGGYQLPGGWKDKNLKWCSSAHFSAGDVVVFHCDLVHKMAKNDSNHCRTSIDSRFALRANRKNIASTTSSREVTNLMQEIGGYQDTGHPEVHNTPGTKRKRAERQRAATRQPPPPQFAKRKTQDRSTNRTESKHKVGLSDRRRSKQSHRTARSSARVSDTYSDSDSSSSSSSSSSGSDSDDGSSSDYDSDSSSGSSYESESSHRRRLRSRRRSGRSRTRHSKTRGSSRRRRSRSSSTSRSSSRSSSTSGSSSRSSSSRSSRSGIESESSVDDQELSGRKSKEYSSERAGEHERGNDGSGVVPRSRQRRSSRSRQSGGEGETNTDTMPSGRHRRQSHRRGGHRRRRGRSKDRRRSRTQSKSKRSPNSNSKSKKRAEDKHSRRRSSGSSSRSGRKRKRPRRSPSPSVSDRHVGSSSDLA